MLRPSKQRPEYFVRILKYCDSLGCSIEQFPNVIKRMYEEEMMSADEIAEVLSQTQKISPRSVLRWIDYYGIKKRIPGDAFRLASSRGRIHWHHKDPLLRSRYKRVGGHSGAKIRYAVMKRDGFKCTLCGSTASDAPLEIDHIVPLCKGGADTMENKRTLCNICNTGKQLEEKER